MENAELIQALKEDAEWAHGNEWETPITLGDHLDAAVNALESLTAQLAESQRRERAAVEMLIKFIKQSDDACDYCKNLIECKGEGCECFEQGKGGTSDGKEVQE